MKRLEIFNSLAERSFKKRLSAGKKIGLMLDVVWERLMHGTELQDYFQYEFYKLKSSERRSYMTFSKLRYTMRVCNAPEKRADFDDKALFNKAFDAFIKREWLDVSEASFDEFESFINKHRSFFVKARRGMFGQNAGKYDESTHADAEKSKALYERLKASGCIAEQLIGQHAALAAFNPSSLNTLRIVTLLPTNGEPKIMAGVFRIGRQGKTADNFHHQGIAATIDVATGVVNAPGIDRDFNRYIVHPDSGVPIVGFKIPSWDRAVELVKKAALVMPDVRYVGWDVAVEEDGGVQLIEGNYGADPDVTQMPPRTGVWPLFKPYLDEIKRNTK